MCKKRGATASGRYSEPLLFDYQASASVRSDPKGSAEGTGGGDGTRKAPQTHVKRKV